MVSSAPQGYIYSHPQGYHSSPPQGYTYSPHLGFNYSPPLVYNYAPYLFNHVNPFTPYAGDAEVVEVDDTIKARTCDEEGGLFQNKVNPKDWYMCVKQEDGSLKAVNWQTQWWVDHPGQYPGPARRRTIHG
eukprot:TRINITY_DN20901_c0_g1_i1.p2 TRINITY_DN20901_c0_g1~~TRINITY_DN20901_c0_g1_i1.p2  ORF type:complete len:131 (-),score=35.87 TRINITY_DN20901_c0_g1_i1:287-679(-)